jgi:hypothetical protein
MAIIKLSVSKNWSELIVPSNPPYRILRAKLQTTVEL